jgi:hypothetical protein
MINGQTRNRASFLAHGFRNRSKADTDEAADAWRAVYAYAPSALRFVEGLLLARLIHGTAAKRQFRPLNQ